MSRTRLVTAFAAVAFMTSVGSAGAATFPVGHTVKKIEVAGTAPNELRAVDVHLWYPAEASTAPMSVYKSALHGKALPAQWDPLSWSLTSKLAREDAPVASGATPFPVIVFSHGSVNDPINEATMLELIAASGFIVASPSHVTDTQDDVRIDYINAQAQLLTPPQGPLFPCNNGLPGPCSRTGAANMTGQAILNARMVDRARDISKVLDSLPGWLGARADMAKVGVFGHSRGTLSGLGAAAGSTTWGVAKEPRVRAVMGMASGGTMAASLQANLTDIRIPTLIVAGGRDLNSPQPVNQAMYNQIGCPVVNPTNPPGCANPSNDKRFLVLPDAHHRTFLSTFCDQVQAAGAVINPPNPRAILDAHTFNAVVTNNVSGRAVDYCTYSTFTSPEDITALVNAATLPAGFTITAQNVPTTGLSQDKVTQDMANEAVDFFTTKLAHVVGGDVGGTVPATLSLTLGPAASFGAFTPGVDGTYTASSTATVISSAGDATLSVADPSPNATGRLVNGTFSLASPLLVGGNPLPAVVKTWTEPVSNEPVQIGFSQSIGRTEALRTGAYSKTLTFTLSTTRP